MHFHHLQHFVKIDYNYHACGWVCAEIAIRVKCIHKNVTYVTCMKIVKDFSFSLREFFLQKAGLKLFCRCPNIVEYDQTLCDC